MVKSHMRKLSTSMKIIGTNVNPFRIYGNNSHICVRFLQFMTALFLHTGHGFPRVFTGKGNVVHALYTCISYPPRF